MYADVSLPPAVFARDLFYTITRTVFGRAAAFPSAYCERLTRREAGNFYFTFRLLPAEQRRALCALYAFMRIADDLADLPGAVDDKRRRLAEWRRQFHAALAGHDPHAVAPALRQTVERYRIPAACLEAVLDGGRDGSR